ncbi:ABC transporter ATP-binding protein, partial [Candidatus Micrarchaeota archaeon]|nr:ABC transporter ATP-binding protein [Candidatus Micrarchaeota archaeon]
MNETKEMKEMNEEKLEIVDLHVAVDGKEILKGVT